ncbi:MAG: cellulase family glycosylhydrolase [Candidatus Paceibacterota bacterium]
MANQERNCGSLWPFYLGAIVLMVLLLVLAVLGLYHFFMPNSLPMLFGAIFLGSGMQRPRLRTKDVVMNGTLFLLLAVLPLVFQKAFPEQKQDTERLRIENGRIYQGGREYRQISFNKFDLWLQYLDQGWDHPRGKAKEDAKKAVQELCERGFGMNRTMSPFYAGWYEDVFFDEDPEKQAEERRQFFAATDEMLNDSSACGMHTILSLMWNIETLADLGHHSLHEGLTDPNSLGYQKFKEFAGAVASRYKNRPDVIVEIGNEWDLFADLQKPNGVFDIRGGMDCPDPNEREEVVCVGDRLSPGKIVRDKRNNFTSDELVAFQKRATEFIKSIDSDRLVTSGNAGPRQSAMHLFRSAKANEPSDWGHDNLKERRKYFEMMYVGSGIDIIQIHSYGDRNLAWYQDVARDLGAPLIVGEIGPSGGESRDFTYTSPTNIFQMERAFRVIKDSDIQVALVWAYGDDRVSNSKSPDFRIRDGYTDRFLLVAQQANKDLQTKERQK